jgi:hypothetical protein
MTPQSLKKSNGRLISLSSFAICFIILIYRYWFRVVNPHLWAEDGVIFLNDTLANPFGQFFTPYAGYFHTIPRILSVIGVKFFGISHFPLFVIISTLSIYAAAAAYLTHRRFRHIVSNDYTRMALAILICFVPGMREVGGNLANLHWILYFYCWLVLIVRPEAKFALIEFVLLALSLLSCGETIVLLPLVFSRMWLTRKLHRDIRIQNFIILLMLILSVTLNLSVRGSDEPMQIASVTTLGNAFGLTIAQQVILNPFVGPSGIYNVTKHMNFWFLIFWCVLILSLCGFAIWRHKSKRIVLGGLILTLGVPVMTWIVREPSIHYFSVVAPPESYFEIRYAFQLAPFAVIFWFLFFDSFKITRKWLILVVFFAFNVSAAKSTTGNPHSYQFLPYSASRSWQHDAKTLIEAVSQRCPRDAFVPVNPESLGFTFSVPEKDRTTPCP